MIFCGGGALKTVSQPQLTGGLREEGLLSQEVKGTTALL